MDDYIDLRHLKIVLVVAEELHTGKAAERLKVDQSTVSRGIRQFEKEQELTFFVRSNKRIVDLTHEGRGYLELIKPAFSTFLIQAARANDAAEMIVRKGAATFTLGYSPLVPAALLNQVRLVRSVRFPALRLQIRQLKPSSIMDFLGTGGLHAGLTYAFPPRHGLEQIPVGKEELCGVYPLRSVAPTREGIRLEDLRSQPVYILSSEREGPEIREYVIAQCARCGFTPRIVEEPVSAREAFDLLLDGGGIAIMPQSMYVGAPDQLASSRIRDLEEIEMVLTCQRDTDGRTQRIVREIGRLLRDMRTEKVG